MGNHRIGCFGCVGIWIHSMIRIVRTIGNIIRLMTSLDKIIIRKADGNIQELGSSWALFRKVTSKITLALLFSMTNAFYKLLKFITLRHRLHFHLFHLLLTNLMTFPYPNKYVNDLRMFFFLWNFKKYLFEFYVKFILNLNVDLKFFNYFNCF